MKIQQYCCKAKSDAGYLEVLKGSYKIVYKWLWQEKLKLMKIKLNAMLYMLYAIAMLIVEVGMDAWS